MIKLIIKRDLLRIKLGWIIVLSHTFRTPNLAIAHLTKFDSFKIKCVKLVDYFSLSFCILNLQKQFGGNINICIEISTDFSLEAVDDELQTVLILFYVLYILIKRYVRAKS